MKALFEIAVFHNMGDILLCTPIARQLKADYPGCQVVWFTAEAYAFILDNNPYVDQVVALADKLKQIRNGLRALSVYGGKK